MKHSPYITWAKQQHEITYNLAGSGMPAKPLRELVDDPALILESGDHEDGWPPLKQRIARRYEVAADQVVLVNSATMANHLVCGLFLDPGDEVIVETPGYKPLQSVCEYYRAKVYQFNRAAEAKYQPDINQLEDLISDRTKLIILSDMHNPSGAKLEASILRSIVKIAEDHQAYILIDEVYLEFLYLSGALTAARISPYVITTRSLTKAFGLDDVRIGWVISNTEIAAKLQRLNDLFTTTLPFPSERLGAVAIDLADNMLAINLRLLKENSKLVNQFVESEPELSWIPPDHGTVGFIRYENGNTDALVKTLRDEYETLVVPGRFFNAPDYFRLGWGIDTDILNEGLSRLSEAIQTH